MYALVVYESMYGNTREIAERIAAGLRTEVRRVDVRRVGDVDMADAMYADILVVGGPTHAHGMSRRTTRRAAVDQPTQYGGGSVVEPGAGGMGLREWFESLPTLSGQAAAFDTRADAAPVFTGRASRGIARCLRRAGLTLVAEPTSFLVTKAHSLKATETDRAERWGKDLAKAAVRASASERAQPGTA